MSNDTSLLVNCCSNCELPVESHAEGHCLFAPTSFKPMTVLEFLDSSCGADHVHSWYDVQAGTVMNRKGA